MNKVHYIKNKNGEIIEIYEDKNNNNENIQNKKLYDKEMNKNNNIIDDENIEEVRIKKSNKNSTSGIKVYDEYSNLKVQIKNYLIKMNIMLKKMINQKGMNDNLKKKELKI